MKRFNDPGDEQEQLPEEQPTTTSDLPVGETNSTNE